LHLKSFGKPIYFDFGVFVFSPNKLGVNRLGITITKKVSKSAVVRNRYKRIAREFFRLHLYSLLVSHEALPLHKNINFDCVFIATKRDLNTTSEKVISNNLACWYDSFARSIGRKSRGLRNFLES
jgi:ribonuclease P protein component